MNKSIDSTYYVWPIHIGMILGLSATLIGTTEDTEAKLLAVLGIIVGFLSFILFFVWLYKQPGDNNDK